MPTINMFDASKYGLESTAMLSGDVAVQQSNAGTAADSLGVPHRLYQLLTKLEKLLSEKYAFDVFAKDSINFGIMVTYRQTWKPENYQVGDLISTLPLSPKEVRRFTSRMVSKKTRAVKELEDSLITRREESSDTSRIDAEIVDKAQNKSNFTITANETINAEAYTINSTQSATLDQVKDSAKTKKEFHESVLKSAQEYKQQHRMEIDTSENQENENTTFHEIQNPNDELAVTYLFYELQRTYRLNEKIHKLTPVILVANDVPAPNEIDDAWLVKHDWMLRRVILDDSFRPALEYLTKSFVGAEVNIRILENNAQLQKNIVDKLNQQIQLQTAILAMSQGDVENATRILAVSEVGEATINNIKRMLDPIGITGETDTGTQDAAQTMLDYAKETANRAEREKARLLSQLEVAMTALQAAVNQLSKAVKEHYDKIAEIDRLRVHVKDNILHYMQAIWSFEPPDQRFFRLAQKIEVPVIEEEGTNLDVDVYSLGSTFEEFVQEYKGFSVELPVPKIKVTKKKLVEVANLDNLLGYKGNYMIFPLKENNFITLHMMQNYLEVGDVLTVRDPDVFGSYTLDDIQRLAACVYKKDPETFSKYRDQFKKMIIDRLTASRVEDDRVIVPTKSLYIEALVGTHPLLEDFKLIHRALDVKKVQAEVRHAELENIRLASRALKGKDEDPDIEKKIVIETDNQNITIQPDGN